MPAKRSGSVHLFRVAGIDVFLHWSWFLVAVYQIQARSGLYSSYAWNVAEYLALFLIVLLHEFGHALACRQTGGTANTIVLWPLGGVAFVDPPQRPGATLWSLAAGPLVNVVLMPVLFVAALAVNLTGFDQALPDLRTMVHSLLMINLVLLVFNLLPIYPLDGGQILRSLLWFFLGRTRSLMVATALGFVALVAAVGWGLWMWKLSMWNLILACFLLSNCWRGFQVARVMKDLEDAPRRQGFACPSCHAAPPFGEYWLCPHCRQQFDPFSSERRCYCMTGAVTAPCVHCGAKHPVDQWVVPTAEASADNALTQP